MKQLSSIGTARITIIQFPGSNCDADCMDAFARHFQLTSNFVWHRETSLPPTDALIIPGGFSYGDYLRAGALASHSPIMAAIKSYIQKGGAVLGICNGFQILCEAQLLPGVLLNNDNGKFRCEWAFLKSPADTNVLKIPIAHGQGRFFVKEEKLPELWDHGQVLFQYCDREGELGWETNPNGSVQHIAGIQSANGKVWGMMPHPERACDELIGSTDGLSILERFLGTAVGGKG